MFENYRKTIPALFISGSCGTFVAPLMTALLLVSVPVASALAQTPQPPSNVTVLPGYSITAVTTGLNFPTAMTFYRDTIWVTEEGTATSPPAVKQIDNKGNVTTILTATMLPAGTIVSPMTGIVFDRGWFWLVHRQTNSTNAPGVPVGAISLFRPNDPVGTFQTLIAGFPSFGDHPNSQIVFGADGRAYINGAAPTNSSVVGPDNGWAQTTPTLHDFPGVDIELSGIGYQTLIPFPPLDPAGGTPAAKITEPYMAFGGGTVPARTVVKAPTPAKPIQGIIAGGGTVYSFDPDAANPALTMRLEAWGFRNPYGIGIDPFNPTKLFVSNNGSDVRETTINGQLVVRGSRPIDNDWDDMFVVNIGARRARHELRDCALALHRLCSGPLRGMFDGPTNAGEATWEKPAISLNISQLGGLALDDTAIAITRADTASPEKPRYRLRISCPIEPTTSDRNSATSEPPSSSWRAPCRGESPDSGGRRRC